MNDLLKQQVRMSHPTLAIFGYSEAAMFLRDRAAPHVAAIISIHGQREFGVQCDCPHRLDLEFDDTDVVAPGDLVAMQRELAHKRDAARNGLREIPPSVADVSGIIEFSNRIRSVDGIVLCHCGMGISRSPAAALICLAVWNGPGTERECVEAIRTLRSCAMPHEGMVRIADELLNRSGKLSAALKAMKQLGSTGEHTPI